VKRAAIIFIFGRLLHLFAVVHFLIHFSNVLVGDHLSDHPNEHLLHHPSGSFSSTVTDDDALLLNSAGYPLNANGTGGTSTTVARIKRRLVNCFHDVRDRIVANFVSATGFVTFRTRRAQVSAVRMPILSDQYPRMIAVPAPAPNDVIWSNMSAPQHHTEDVAYFTSAAYYCGLFFWSLVMAFIAALSNVSTLQQYFPSMQQMNPYVYAVLQGILPVVVMLSFSYLLVNTMCFISIELERRKTYSAVDQEVFKWYVILMSFRGICPVYVKDYNSVRCLLAVVLPMHAMHM
jgi:hypothetical protein